VRGLVPLHHQVYSALRNALDIGQWKPGEQLPTEKALAEAHGCSLITVRRALDELVRERRITRIRGKGTFALRPPLDRELTALTSFTDEMNARGLDSYSTVVTARVEPASPVAAQHLNLPPGSPVYRIERIRHVDNSPLLLEDVLLPAGPFPHLLEQDLVRGSLYDILAAKYGVELARGDETLEPALPTAREAKLLEQPQKQPVLLLELVSFTADDIPVEYCRSLVRGDRARYRLDTRRVHSAPSLNTPRNH
jgi:GntR family transcriptional regulator